MIPEAAVEAAARWMADRDGDIIDWTEIERTEYALEARAILEAAQLHMESGADLMRWKLDALKEWSDAMINESNSPQYGRDVRTLLEVGSMDEAREVEAL